MKRTLWLGLAAITVIAGCVSQWTVDRFEAPEANLASRHTYFLKGGDLGTTTALDPAVARQVDASIRSTLGTEFATKGYAEAATAAAADMVLSYQVAGTRRFVISDERRIGAPSPNTVLSPSAVQPPPLSTLPREQAVRDGTVIVFVEDAANGKLIWRGLITAETRIGSTEAGIRTVTEMTRAIAHEFPARTVQALK